MLAGDLAHSFQPSPSLQISTKIFRLPTIILRRETRDLHNSSRIWTCKRTSHSIHWLPTFQPTIQSTKVTSFLIELLVFSPNLMEDKKLMLLLTYKSCLKHIIQLIGRVKMGLLWKFFLRTKISWSNSEYSNWLKCTINTVKLTRLWDTLLKHALSCPKTVHMLLENWSRFWIQMWWSEIHPK